MTAATLALLALVYAAGVGRAWGRLGLGRGVSTGEAVRFGLAWIALAGALISPLEPLSGRLLSAHMLQHLLLVVVAAPLFAASGMGRAFLYLMPRSLRTSFAADLARWRPLEVSRRALSAPLAVLAVYVACLWLWHAPGAYQAALGFDLVHVLEHGSLVAAACLFWVSVLPGPGGKHRRAGAIPALLGASFAVGGLGALMALSPTPWYAAYAAVAAATGGDAVRDQQVAGLLMWMPMGAIHAAAALYVAAGWLRSRGEPARLVPASPKEAPA